MLMAQMVTVGGGLCRKTRQGVDLLSFDGDDDDGDDADEATRS